MRDSGLPAAMPMAQKDTRLLAGLLAGASVVTVDFFAVLAALPLLQRELAATPGQLQLIVAGYAIVTACFLIAGGRLGDAWGRRRVFVAGLALFALGALGCSASVTAGAIVGWRLLQGLGGALLQPQVLGLLAVSFDDKRRPQVFGAYATSLAASAVAAQVLGGALVQWLPADLGWRLCFLLTVPLCLLATWLTAALAAERGDGNPSVDKVGILILAMALGSLSAALTLGRDQGWPAWAWVAGGCGLLGMLAMVLWQRRGAGQQAPRLIPPGLLGVNGFTLAVGGVLLFYAGVSSFYLVYALSLRASGHFTPAAVGLVFGLMAVALAVGASSRRARERVGDRWLGLGTCLLVVGHLGWLGALSLAEPMGLVAGVLAAALAQGAGLGMLMGRLMAHALSQLKPQQASVGSGVASTMQQLGNSIGVVLIGLAYFDDLGTGRDLPAAVTYLVLTLTGLWLLVRGVASLRQRRRPLPTS